MRVKALRKTIKSNPLDKIEAKAKPIGSRGIASTRDSASMTVKNSAVKTQSPQAGSSINRGRKNMQNEDKKNDAQLDPQVVSADQILSAEIKSTSNSSDQDAVVIDYRHKLAKTTITNASQWATVAGFIPVVGLDTITISGVQLKMVYDLCEIYKIPFKKEAVLAVVGAALGGSLTTIAATKVAGFGISKIPYIGPVISVLNQPAISFATTYAVGLLFVKHFENNGDLLNFDLDSTKAVFDKEFEKAKALYSAQLKNAKTIYSEQVAKAKRLFSRNVTEAAESSATTA